MISIRADEVSGGGSARARLCRPHIARTYSYDHFQKLQAQYGVYYGISMRCSHVYYVLRSSIVGEPQGHSPIAFTAIILPFHHTMIVLLFLAWLK